MPPSASEVVLYISSTRSLVRSRLGDAPCLTNVSTGGNFSSCLPKSANQHLTSRQCDQGLHVRYRHRLIDGSRGKATSRESTKLGAKCPKSVSAQAVKTKELSQPSHFRCSPWFSSILRKGVATQAGLYRQPTDLGVFTLDRLL